MANAFKRIFNQGITKNPFTAHKRYEVTNVNHSSSFEISVFRGVSDNGVLLEVSKSKHQGVEYDSTILTGSGATSTELNKIPQQVIWRTVNSACFKKDGRLLHPTASIVSIPQYKIGLGIKPESLLITDESHYAANLTLSESRVDGEHGVIFDDDIDGSGFIDTKYSKLYLGFQDGVHGKKYKLQKDSSPRKQKIESTNLTIVPGIDTTGEVTASGYAIQTTSQSVLYAPHFDQEYSFLNHQNNFSLSFWVKLPPSQSYTDRTINNLIQKRNQAYNPYLDYKAGATGSTSFNHSDAQFPFRIGVYNQTAGSDNGKLVFQYDDGVKSKADIRQITSSAINDDSWHNVILDYNVQDASSGIFNFYLDGTAITGVTASRPFQNQSDITIMCDNGNGGTGTSGSIDEVRLYNTNLSADNITSLTNNHIISGSAYQTRNVGYTFYKKGLIVVSDPRPKYQNCFLGDGNWDYTNRPFEFEYRSTKDIEQQSILCEIGRGEFNVSTNNTLRKSGDDTNNSLKDFVTGSDFRPYITQVGLYNDSGELLAIGKLGSPLKKRQDVDVTIDVRLDFE